MIRQAKLDELDTIERLYDIARRFMRDNGNESQWINGYPSKELLTKDIDEHHLFVMYDEDSIYGVFAFIIGEDPTYAIIKDGKWLNNNPYGTIHRIASNGEKKGVLSECVNWATDQVKDIRADTHANNKIMQKCLTKNGFTYCGIIYVEDGSERLAYHKC